MKLCRVLLAGALLCALSQTASAVVITVSFQNGDSNGYAGTLDTYIHEDSSTTNQGANSKVYVDGDDDLGIGESQAQEVQGLIRFNNLFVSGGGASRIGGPIPDGSVITKATLTMRTGTGSGDISASEFRLHRMLANWDESATWATMGATSGLGVARDNVEAVTAATAVKTGAGLNTAGGLVSWDVTADVQTWSSDNTLSLRGWLVHPDSVNLGGNPVSGQSDGWLFDSSEAAIVANRPMLIIEYQAIPEPTTLALAAIGGVGLVLAGFRRRHSRVS